MIYFRDVLLVLAVTFCPIIAANDHLYVAFVMSNLLTRLIGSCRNGDRSFIILT